MTDKNQRIKHMLETMEEQYKRGVFDSDDSTFRAEQKILASLIANQPVANTNKSNTIDDDWV